jgi:hypothetical protein
VPLLIEVDNKVLVPISEIGLEYQRLPKLSLQIKKYKIKLRQLLLV